MLNRLFLGGIIVAEPQTDADRDGNPVTLLLVAFPAPDEKDPLIRQETASCEVEVPNSVAEQHGKELRTGVAVFIAGQLNGGGGIVATEIHSVPQQGHEPDADWYRY